MDPHQLTDSELKMAASTTFDYILEQIKTSNLNFWLQMSPFSATISIKKSLVKDKSGLPLMPPVSKPVKLESDDTDLAQKVSKLEAASENLRKNYEDSLDDCE